jgi:hypothetical protein
MNSEVMLGIDFHLTVAHVIGVKHLKVMTCFIVRTKTLIRSYI